MRVLVEAGSRIHLGFLDPTGALGRRWGSIGLYLKEPALMLEAWRTRGLEVEGPSWLLRLASKAVDMLKVEGIGLRARSLIPRHVGLGSGTQTALAVAAAASALYGFNFNAVEAARSFGRCRRSAAGLWLFLRGGLVVDGGVGARFPPPLLVRTVFPESWKIILMTPLEEGGGLHGRVEEEMLGRPARSAPERAAATVLIRLLPSLVERDFETFCSAVEELDRLTGETLQGRRYSSSRIERAAKALKEAGARGVGQSSWGPTVYGFAEDEAEAEAILDKLKEPEGYRAMATSARNLEALVHLSR